MTKKKINKLKDAIINKVERFVNLYSSKFSSKSKKKIERFLSLLMGEYENIFHINVDIQKFENCTDEEQEAKVLIDLINKELKPKDINTFQEEAISIANAIYKWGNKLEGQALLVFYFFSDPYNEKEKNILRSLRKTIRNQDDISSYLRILIISNRKVSRWQLFPESNLDDRHVAFFEY